jgi:hypothetical protein
MALDGAFQRTVQRAPRSPKQAFRPFLGSVQDAQYTHGVASHAVGDHKGVWPITSSRVPSTRPGRPLCGNSIRV